MIKATIQQKLIEDGEESTPNKVKIQPFPPVIKWSGSKRSQVKEILRYIPKFKKYYEPFVGGGSVVCAVHPETGICGDICQPLIKLWNMIKNSPEELADYYDEYWHKLQDDYRVYYEVRENFNKTQSPQDLLFLSRTCVNGLIRFNANGEFNNSLHYTRKGIEPNKMRDIISRWSVRLSSVDFICGDYRETTKSITEDDFLYLDPPYFYTRGRYYGTIDFSEFYDYLEDLTSNNIRYMLSFDGVRGDKDYSVAIPSNLYKRHILIPSGNSSFKKVMDGKKEEVFESLYMNY